ncbi:MAG: bifunctional nuclease family protein, partial [Haloarculaceae archaeon]
DLFVDMVAEFGAAIDRVRIDDLADGTFYAKIDTEQYHGSERNDMVFDARPSDGIALALRVDCPIIVSDEVLDEAGRDPDELGFADEEDVRDEDVGFGEDPGDEGLGFGEGGESDPRGFGFEEEDDEDDPGF